MSAPRNWYPARERILDFIGTTLTFLGVLVLVLYLTGFFG